VLALPGTSIAALLNRGGNMAATNMYPASDPNAPIGDVDDSRKVEEPGAGDDVTDKGEDDDEFDDEDDNDEEEGEGEAEDAKEE
jgi:hypothetical protein